MRLGLLLLALVQFGLAAGRYSAERRTDQGVALVELADTEHQARVTIAPGMGNRAIAFLVKGKNILYFPWKDAAAFRESGMKQLNGIPFLAPWANRVTDGGFWAGDKRYRFNPDLGTLRFGPENIAIHGLLTTSPLWEVVSVHADNHSAQVTSRLAFWKHPDLMANWPFAHEYEMTYVLKDGELEVRTKVTNLSSAPMPIAVGFHPYFVLPDTDRATASVHLPVREHVQTDSRLVATGVFEPASLPQWVSLQDHTFDDGYRGLTKDDKGQVVFSLRSGQKRIDVRYGEHYQVAVVYAPPGQPFVCFEPMSSITNGLNLAHEGKYRELQTVAPGSSWVESFWVSATL
jgi:aldose 1-epimerase